MRADDIGIDLKGSLQGFDSLRMAAGVEQGAAQMAMPFGGIRLDLRRPGDADDGLFAAPGGAKGDAEAVMRVRIAGVDSQCLVEARDGFLVAGRFAQDFSQAVVNRGKVGPDRNGSCVAGDRRLQPLQGRIGGALHVEKKNGVGILPRQFFRSFQNGCGIPLPVELGQGAELLRTMTECCEFVPCLRVGGVLLECRLIQLFCLTGCALPDKKSRLLEPVLR